MPKDNWLDALRRKYAHPAELRAQAEAARAGLNAAEESLLRACPPPGRAVLVMGCGAGRETIALAARGYRVTGADLAPGPLAACEDALARARLTADLVHLAAPAPWPFPDGSFAGVVLFGQVLEHAPAREERLLMLAEAARVLVPAGRVHLGTHAVLPGDGDELRRLAPDPRHPAEIRARRISAAASPGLLFLHLYSREELAADLEAAGLQLLAWLVQEEPGEGHPVWRRFLYAAAEKRK